MVDGSGLENRQAERPRGFESHPLRQLPPFRQNPPRRQKRAHDSEKCGEKNIGKIMGADIHARKTDQQRNRQKRETNAETDKKQGSEKCGRGRGVAGWKCMKLRAEARPVPKRFSSHRWPCTTGRDLNNARGSAGEETGNEHRNKNARPFFISAPIRNQNENTTKRRVLWPVAPSTDIAHENPCAAVLMMRNPALYLKIKVKGANESNGAEQKKQDRADPRLLCHNGISRLSFMRRYL